MLHCCVFRSQKEVRFSIPLIVWKSQIVWKPIQNKNNAGRKIAVEEAKTSLTLEMILKSLYFFPKNQMVFISFILESCVFQLTRKSSNPKGKRSFNEKGKVQKKLQKGHLSDDVKKVLISPFITKTSRLDLLNP